MMFCPIGLPSAAGEAYQTRPRSALGSDRALGIKEIGRARPSAQRLLQIGDVVLPEVDEAFFAAGRDCVVALVLGTGPVTALLLFRTWWRWLWRR